MDTDEEKFRVFPIQVRCAVLTAWVRALLGNDHQGALNLLDKLITVPLGAIRKTYRNKKGINDDFDEIVDDKFVSWLQSMKAAYLNMCPPYPGSGMDILQLCQFALDYNHLNHSAWLTMGKM
eukprot:TRINITY_DN12488_c0_g1_i1.p2 TRINITY_DN12488_c0_g1~~TRINITY_DN12488_c0_g1_i1.p2  ORF type:complete len:122 (-),score=18.33 TRINITY_DN12488_c0_g1_i1:8-373(-)